MTPKEFEFLNATQEQKAAAWEWLREEALRRHNRRWFHAAVLMEEIKRLNESRDAASSDAPKEKP